MTRMTEKKKKRSLQAAAIRFCIESIVVNDILNGARQFKVF